MKVKNQQFEHLIGKNIDNDNFIALYLLKKKTICI
jgi:hypothetical protein